MFHSHVPYEPISRYNQLQAEKNDYQDLMRNINNFFAPSDKIFLGQQPVNIGLRRAGELLDTTVSQIIEEHVQTTFGLYFNTEVAWFRIEDPSLNISDRDAKVLSNRTKLLYRLISKSNYYSVAPQHEWDVVVHGHGLMAIEADSDNFARCYTREPIDLYFVQSEDYSIIEMYWTVDFTAPALRYKYPDIENYQSNSILETRTVVYSVVPNTSYYRSALPEEYKKKFESMSSDKFIYRQSLISQGKGLIGKAVSLFQKPYRGDDIEPPQLIDGYRFIPARNIPSRQHPYGDGVGKKAIVSARILNKLTRDGLLASGRMANPPRLISPIFKSELQGMDEIQEGKLVVASTNQGGNLKLQDHVATLDVRSDLNSLLALIQHQEAKASNILPTTSSTYKVARQSQGEIQQRLQEQEKRLSPIRAHYLKESVSKHLRRFWDIAKKQKYFEADPFRFENPDLEKMSPKFNFDAFLLQTHRLTKALLINQALAQTNPVFALSPSASHWVDGDKSVHAIFAGNSVEEFLKPADDVEEQRSQIEAESQRQQQSQQTLVDAQARRDSATALEQVRKSIGSADIGETVA